MQANAAPVSGVPLTIACWMRTQSTLTTQVAVAIGRRTGTTAANRFQIQFRSDGRIAGACNNGDASQSTLWSDASGANYAANTWYHGCVVFESNTSRHVYRNGAAKASNTTSVNVGTIDTTTLGGRYDGAAIGLRLNGQLAEVGIWNAALTDGEVRQLGRGASPLMVRPEALVAYYPLWGNGSTEEDWFGTNALTNTGTTKATTHPFVVYPPKPRRTKLAGGAGPNPIESGSSSQSVASAVLSTGIQLLSSAISTSAAAAVLTVGSAAMTSDALTQSAAQAALTTGIQLQASASSTSSATAVLPSVTTTLSASDAGDNANASLSVINNANTDTPTAVIRFRSPEDSEWQQGKYKLIGVRNKTVTNEWLLTEKEDADSYLGTWQGPWYSFDGVNWTNQPSWSQVAGDRMTFVINCGANDEVWIASLPPWTQDTVAAWIGALATAHPTRIKDDLPSRIALGDPSAYVVGRSGTGTDENGRSVSNLPLYSFVIRDDALGDPANKRWIELWSGVHSGEWNGGLQLRGAVNEILNGTHSTALLSRFIFVVRPILSPKGNYLGFRRNEAAASYLNNLDANREWADGDTSLATVVQWQGILDTDHGVAHGQKVVGFFDFHDGKNTSNTAWFYYQPGSTIATSFLDLVNDENAAIISIESTSDGNTSDYWESKGIKFNWTCEGADEKSTVAQVEAFGAAYMRALKTADDAGLVPQLHPLNSAATSTSAATATLTTSFALQASASSASTASAVLLAGADVSAAAASQSQSQATLTTGISLQGAAASAGEASASLIAAIRLEVAALSLSSATADLTAGAAPFAAASGSTSLAQAALTTAIQMLANAESASRATAVLVDPDAGAPAGNITHRSVTPVYWSARVRA